MPPRRWTIGAVGLVADMADPDQAAAFVEAGRPSALGGTLDIVVANAGGPPGGTFASHRPGRATGTPST